MRQMKTIKEILDSHNIKEDTPYHNYIYLYESIVKAMDEFGKQSFENGRKYHLHNSYLYNDFNEYINEINGVD